MVLGVRGLEIFGLGPRVAVKPKLTTRNVSGNHFAPPGDLPHLQRKPLYDGASMEPSEDRRGGQIRCRPTMMPSGSAAGLSPGNLQLVPIDSSTGFNSGDEVEADLDVQWSGGVAKTRHPLCLRGRSIR